MIYSDNTFDITNNIATYTRRDFKSVFDTTSNKWYSLVNGEYIEDAEQDPAPTISTLWASTIYRNSAHLTKLMRNDDEMVKMDYMNDDILKKGEVPPPAPVGPANDEIWYTSTNGNIVTPYYSSSLPVIVSNTYVDGKGVIKFKTEVTSIGDGAFFDCTSLTSIEIPDSVVSIRTLCFCGCTSLLSINIPNNITTLENATFQNCSSLQHIEIPNTVTSIGDNAFFSCTSLTSILYDGTKAQWAAITKGRNWKQSVPRSAVVHCNDGDTPI